MSELSKLKIKELKMILEKQKIKNYSNLSKNELLKKIKEIYIQKGGAPKNQNKNFLESIKEYNSERQLILLLEKVNEFDRLISELEEEKLNIQRKIEVIVHAEEIKNKQILNELLKIQCPSFGWWQQSNDCWIDSAYYAMFVPNNLRDWFLKFLNSCMSQKTNGLKNFSKYSLEYLEGITNGDSPSFLLKKQSIKKNILLSIRESLSEITGSESAFIRSLLRGYNTVAENPRMNSTGMMNSSGNGDVSIFFLFISKIDKNFRFFQRPDWTNNSGMRQKPIQNYIISRLSQKNIKDNISIVVIDASFYIPDTITIDPLTQSLMNDNTLLSEISNINNFSLEAVIRGNKYHFTVDFKCNDDNWYNYDNTNEVRKLRIKKIDVRTRNWIRHDGLIFIFRHIS